MSNTRIGFFRFLSFALFGGAVVAGCATADPDEEAGSSTSELQYSGALGDRIANTARRVDGRPSRNACLAEVQNSLEAAGVRAFPRLPGAVDLDNFMVRQGAALSAWGFQKQAHGVDDLPRGSIIAWRPGQCGYHPTYGHIEVVIGGGRACSDFCGSIARGCGAPDVYVPVSAGGSASAGAGAGAGGGACAVGGDSKLHCTNRGNTPLRATPTAGGVVVDTLRTTTSWFDCWTTGERHAGGNTTWYSTRGDDHGKQGFIAGVNLETPDAFDANPTAKGLRHCP